MSDKSPLIVVKRKYYDQFVSGEKTIEYRRIRGSFTERVYYSGRRVKLAYNYDIGRFPYLTATVTCFAQQPARLCPQLMELDPTLDPDEPIAAIYLQIDR